MQRSKRGALSKSQNWSAGPWPNQSFCQRNKLYPRDFAGKQLLRVYYLRFYSPGWIALI